MPFLDLKLLDVAMTLPPEFKHPKLTKHQMEKELLRSAFDIKDDDGFGHVKEYLPSDILWRQKEQFSDGVGYSWIDTLKVHAESCVTDEEWEDRHDCMFVILLLILVDFTDCLVYPYNTPTTREALFYRRVFEDFYCPESLCPTVESKLPVRLLIPGVQTVSHLPNIDFENDREMDSAKGLGLRRRSLWTCTESP